MEISWNLLDSLSKLTAIFPRSPVNLFFLISKYLTIVNTRTQMMRREGKEEGGGGKGRRER